MDNFDRISHNRGSKKPADRSHDGEQSSGERSPSSSKGPRFYGSSNVELPPNAHPSLGLVLEAGRWWGKNQMERETQGSHSDQGRVPPEQTSSIHSNLPINTPDIPNNPPSHLGKRSRSEHSPDTEPTPKRPKDTTHSYKGRETIDTIDGKIDVLDSDKLNKVHKRLVNITSGTKGANEETKRHASEILNDFEILKYYFTLQEHKRNDKIRVDAREAYNRLEAKYDSGDTNETAKGWYKQIGFKSAQGAQEVGPSQQLDTHSVPQSTKWDETQPAQQAGYQETHLAGD